MQYKRFSDFADDEALPLKGDKVKIEDVIDKEILVTGFKLMDSKYNKNGHPKCLTLQIELNKEEHIVFTGSNVLIDQVERYKDEMPFLSTIKRIQKYYTFT